MIKLKTKKNNKLTKSEINSIIRLKSSFWKYNIKSQLAFLKKNYKKNDIHNLFYKGKNLVGYNALKIRKNKFLKFSIFDAFIISKKYQNKKLSIKLMKHNKEIIEKLKVISFLTCKNNLSNFYKKLGWKKINNSKYKIKKLKKNYLSMSFNDFNNKNFNNIKPINIEIK